MDVTTDSRLLGYLKPAERALPPHQLLNHLVGAMTEEELSSLLHHILVERAYKEGTHHRTPYCGVQANY